MPKWGYFVQNLWPKMWSNIEQHREKGEREGEAQNTTLHAKFSKKPSMFRQRMYRFSRASRKRFKLWWTDRKCGMGVFRTKSVTENVEQYRETGEREGEAQNTTFLNVSFRVSSVPDFLDDGSRQFRIIRFVKEVNAGFCGWNFGFFLLCIVSSGFFTRRISAIPDI